MSAPEWRNYLQPSSVQFIQEIINQIPEANGLRIAFEALLDKLATAVDKDTQSKLDKLAALERNGVDNWEYYDDAMEELEADEDSD